MEIGQIALENGPQNGSSTSLGGYGQFPSAQPSGQRIAPYDAGGENASTVAGELNEQAIDINDLQMCQIGCAAYAALFGCIRPVELPKLQKEPIPELYRML